MAGILAICGILPPIYIHPHWPKNFAYIGLTYSTTKASKIDPQYCNNIFLAPINKKKFRGGIVPTQKRWRKDYRGSDPPPTSTITISGHFLIPDFPPFAPQTPTLPPHAGKFTTWQIFARVSRSKVEREGEVWKLLQYIEKLWEMV